MWLKRLIPVLIVVSPAATFLFATDSAPQSTSPFMPSFVAKEQQPSNRVSPNQAPGAVPDPSAVRAADALA